MPRFEIARWCHAGFLAGLCVGVVLPSWSTALAALRPYDLQQLALRSELVITGEVIELRSYRAPFQDLGELFFTDVGIRVDRVLKGEPEGDVVTVQLLGGRIGEAFQVCPDSARYEKGEKVLVFLREYNGKLWNTGWLQGKYRLSPGGTTVEGTKGLPIPEDISLEDLSSRVALYLRSSPSAKDDELPLRKSTEDTPSEPRKVPDAPTKASLPTPGSAPAGGGGSS